MKAIFVMLIVLLYPLSALAAGDHSHHGAGDQKFTQHFSDSLFKITEKGRFSVEVVLKGKELTVGINTVEIVIHDSRDTDVLGAKIEVIPWMPGHGHGVEDKPTITEKGGGLYRIENINFTMGGDWQLKMKIRKADREDSVVFDFPDIDGQKKAAVHHDHSAMHGHHHTSETRAPAVIDTAPTQVSQKKLYKVSYETEPIPMNKIHQWKLQVETADGRPVKNAQITVDGGMPEHGHGLPTKPQVTQELGDGYYLVEGMKFNMPGWWVVTVSVKAGDQSDTVTFNLDLK